MEIEFRQPKLEDKVWIKEYLTKEKPQNCEYTFANILLWAPHYKMEMAVIEDMLVFRLKGEDVISYTFPIGEGSPKKAVDALMEYHAAHFKEQKFSMHLVTPDKFQVLEELYPGMFQVEYNRDSSDYIYETDKLIELPGKKYHGKRNHIHRFRDNENWSYEKMDESNIPDCMVMAQEWRVENGCDDDPDKSAEMCVTMCSLKLFKELDLIGGVLKLDGKVIAFTIGEPVNDEIFVTHIEKAYAAIQGAYPMINQQFAEHELSGYKYINREEDMGSEGLRKAKLSYGPVLLLEKGVVTMK